MNLQERLHNALVNYRIEYESNSKLWSMLYDELDATLYESIGSRYEKHKERITQKILKEYKDQTMLEDSIE